MTDEKLLELLLNSYVRLLELHGSPGEKSHMLAHHTAFIQSQIRQLIKPIISRSDSLIERCGGVEAVAVGRGLGR